jgi:hypothetical protein
VSRICKEAETSKDLSAVVFMSPRKNIKTSKMETNEDNFENNVLCRTMFIFYNTGKLPTLEKIKLSLYEKISYTGLATSALMVLKHFGCKYKKSKKDRILEEAKQYFCSS